MKSNFETYKTNIYFYSNAVNSNKRLHPDSSTDSTTRSTGKSTITADIERLFSELSLTDDDKYSIILGVAVVANAVAVAIVGVGFDVK